MTIRRNPIPIRKLALFALIALIGPATGCTWISYLGTDSRGAERGMTYYVGGAGYLGQVGTIDVPKGLRAGGYRGATECFGWQSIFGGALRDEIDRDRNEGQAQRLAHRITAYATRYPGRPINVIALSAGTGIAVWAVEELPDTVHVRNVVFLGSSLSHRYDLSRALARIDGQLISFYSDSDPILRYAVPLAGSVDREYDRPGGLRPFAPPAGAPPELRNAYASKVRNIGYRKAFARYGHFGGHIDGTNAAFVERYIAPVIRQELPSIAEPPAADAGIPTDTAEPAQGAAAVETH
jgi:pimeloyl-ACP methyl ester carboxylesterase